MTERGGQPAYFHPRARSLASKDSLKRSKRTQDRELELRIRNAAQPDFTQLSAEREWHLNCPSTTWEVMAL
jgi:hypothetical protein